ncbi:CBS domain-containing protein [Thermocoleostomius sinensis A174]|uniref:CBS domain-containing protein n=1 Tax=Thermocoleostomius sinensis A174 TaxID=2016057 RepID=A0A9E8ZBC0_9CYAN|nr:CBS domain-containing protein [Thermocoleostomius sinensis A174]
MVLTETRQVKDFMTTDPVTVKPTDSVGTVLQRLEENHISGLPVVDETGKVVGVVSEADLLFRERPIRLPLYLSFLGGIIYLEPLDHFIQQLKKSLGVLVQDVMTPNPVTIAPEAPISQAADLMLEKRVNRLPVVDAAGVLVGIITRDDLLHVLKSA